MIVFCVYLLSVSLSVPDMTNQESKTYVISDSPHIGNWSVGLEHCQQKGPSLSLAIISTEQDWIKLNNLMVEQNIQEAWVGAKMLETEKHWHWFQNGSGKMTYIAQQQTPKKSHI